MLRLFGFATLVLVAICLAVSAAIALADDGVTPAATTAQDRVIEAVDPDHRIVDDSLVDAEDVYEFDFVVHSDAEPNPEFPNSEVGEPSASLEI
jgi:hypothetical protein